MSTYGFTIPVGGRSLLTKLLAGERLEITRTMVGVGKVPNGVNPATLEDLVEPLAQATATMPSVRDGTATFVIEYRSDMHGGLEHGNYINEFGVFAQDPDEGEVLLYYGNLGDYPQYIPAYRPGSVGILRYPVAITLAAEDIDIVLAFDASAFMTSRDIAEYVEATTLPGLRAETQALVYAHNRVGTAHQDIRNLAAQVAARVGRVEDMLLANITGNPFVVEFSDLEGIGVEGTWNQEKQRIEF